MNIASEDQSTAELALGRILRIASRPFQKGDVEEYERCRQIILSVLPEPTHNYTVSWARDRNLGAAGQD